MTQKINDLKATTLVHQPEKVLTILGHPSKQTLISLFLTNSKFLQLNEQKFKKPKSKGVKSGRVGKTKCISIRGYFFSMKGNLDQLQESGINSDAPSKLHLETYVQSLTVEQDQSYRPNPTEAESEDSEKIDS